MRRTGPAVAALKLEEGNMVGFYKPKKARRWLPQLDSPEGNAVLPTL